MLQLELVDSIGVAASRLRQWFVSRFFLALAFSFQSLFKKCLKIVFFSLWRRDPSAGFGAAIADAVARIVLLCFATQSLQIAL